MDDLRARADCSDKWNPANSQLARLLVEPGDIDELRERADSGDESASREYSRYARDLLIKRIPAEEAIAVVRPGADDGNAFSQSVLAELLATQGSVDELRSRADGGDPYARERYLQHLKAEHDVARLWDEVVGAGTPGADEALVELLRQLRQDDLATQVQDYGLNPDGSVATAASGAAATAEPEQRASAHDE
jgi:hypothetical protein